MLQNINDENVLFLDIETVPRWASYDDIPQNFKTFWDKKSLQFKMNENDTPDKLYERAGIYAEFGKIICISVGFLIRRNSNLSFRIKSFYGDDEALVISQFNSLADKSYNTPDHFLCAHNGKEFDFPYIARRTLINGLKLPTILDIAGRKPWEVRHLDTLELWKFGDYKHFTSLDLLAAIFDIPSPKDDISGKDVAPLYWHKNDLERIVTYCQKDVLTVAQLYLRYKGAPLLLPDNIQIVP